MSVFAVSVGPDPFSFWLVSGVVAVAGLSAAALIWGMCTAAEPKTAKQFCPPDMDTPIPSTPRPSWWFIVWEAESIVTNLPSAKRIGDRDEWGVVVRAESLEAAKEYVRRAYSAAYANYSRPVVPWPISGFEV